MTTRRSDESDEDDEPSARRSGRGPGGGFAPRLASGLLLLLFLLTPAASDAQYFGRNKVQYDDFDFRVLETENFDLHFYEEMSEQAVQDAGRMAERWYERLARTFQHAFRERKPLILYANQPDFQQTNVIRGSISQATGGVTEGLKNRVVLPFAEGYGATDHVLGHELVHAFQYDIAQAGRGGGSTGFQSLPLWAVEGLAEYLSVGRRSSHTAMWMRDAILRDDFPTIEQLASDPQYFPYRYGHALWAYIGGRWGDESVPAFYRSAARRGLKRASKGVLGLPLDTLSSDWTEATRAHFTAEMEGRTPPGEVGDRLVPRRGEEPGLLQAPSVSPDGERIAFLSTRDLFSIDLFLADARTGEVEGKLASAASDPHLDGLAFINSSGAWSPDGSRFAFTAYAEGENRILVADAEEREVVERFRLDDDGVGAVYSLAWSPDGTTLAFAGSDGGVTDLYFLDVESGAVEQVTDDRYTELHPAWSPDGSRLAFTTDRGGSTDLERLTTGSKGIGVMEVGSRRVRVLRPFGTAKHIEPAFAPDGRSFYFISDPGGFSDVYRMNLNGGTVRQVTNVATGVSGITALSPALTVARRNGRVFFTVFTDGNYALHTLSDQAARGERIAAQPRHAPPGLLPPEESRPPRWVASYLEDPATGLPEPGSFSRRDYSSDLTLDYIAQPQGGIAVDRFGTSLGGSVAAFFSDMLGNEQLGVALQANGQVEDIGGQVAYSSLGDRMNWTVQGGRIPYRTLGTRIGTEEVEGQTVRAIDLIQNRTILNRVSTGVRYPFSTTRRFEADAGYTRMNFDREAIRTLVSDGLVIDRRQVELSAPDGLDLYQASAALVEDWSFPGFTSPVRGGRARLEVEGNTGSLTFANVLADYRRYFFFRPVTLAFRGMHYGRYGTDSESDRITPLFLGFERFVRGYAINTFQGSECTEVPGRPQACPEFDRLMGSRVGVGNVELRIPLIGTERFGLLDWGFIPTELSLFADGGLAWTSDESPELMLEEQSMERIPVFSTGASFRFNILGRLILEAYYAIPFQRPGKGGHWGFQLAPGW